MNTASAARTAAAPLVVNASRPCSRLRFELRQARLVDGNQPALQCCDLILVIVAASDLVTEICKACTRYETHIASPNDCDTHDVNAPVGAMSRRRWLAPDAEHRFADCETHQAVDPAGGEGG